MLGLILLAGIRPIHIAAADVFRDTVEDCGLIQDIAIIVLGERLLYFYTRDYNFHEIH